MDTILQTHVGRNCHIPVADLIFLLSAGAGVPAEDGVCVCGGGLQHVQSLSRGAPGGWSRACCPGLCHWLWVGPASLPPALPPPPSSSISSLSLSRPSHPSCINWVWCWNPPLAAHAHVQPAAVKTSMFSATIMIIAAEHSAEGISKSD